jgi:hypothetical protein
LSDIDEAALAYSEGFLEELLTESAARGTPAAQKLLDNYRVVQAGLHRYRKKAKELQGKFDRIRQML